jgi:hypothetical protein
MLVLDESHWHNLSPKDQHSVHFSACALIGEMLTSITTAPLNRPPGQSLLLDARLRGAMEPLSICTPQKAKDKPASPKNADSSRQGGDDVMCH